MKNKALFAVMLFVSMACAHASTRDSSVVRLDNIVVTGVRYETDLRHLPMTLSVVTRDKLTADYQQSVLPTLTQQVPGLFTTSRGMLGYGVSTGAAGTIKVRGIGGMADMLMLIDGLPQYAGLYGHPIADSYQTMTAQRVEVLRGPASVIYGSNAMGGVVNIVTRQMEQDGVNTNVNLQGGSYGTYQGTVVNRLRRGKFTSLVGGSYGHTDGHRENSAFTQGSGFVKLGYDISKYWNLAGYTNVTYFESENPGTTSAPMIDNKMMITRGNAAVSLTNDYGKTSGALRAFINWGHHHINDGYQTGGKPQTAFYLHNDQMMGFSLYQSISLFTGNRLTGGIDFTHFGGHAWNRVMADGTEKDIIRKTENEVAGYLDLRQQLTPWLIADAGIRLDHHSQAGNEWVPQGSLTFLPSQHSTLRATVSKGFRFPTIRELYMFRPANQDLEPVRLKNYELGYKHYFLDDRLMVGANVYYINADNMIETRMVDGRPHNVNTGATENSGFELQTAFDINPHWSFNANYSYLHMSHPQIAAPEHKLFVGGTFSQGPFRVNAGLQYVANLYTATGTSEQKEHFCLLNVTADYHVSKGLNLFVRGENLLAQEYETQLGFPMPRATVMCGINWNF